MHLTTMHHTKKLPLQFALESASHKPEIHVWMRIIANATKDE